MGASTAVKQYVCALFTRGRTKGQIYGLGGFPLRNHASPNRVSPTAGLTCHHYYHTSFVFMSLWCKCSCGNEFLMRLDKKIIQEENKEAILYKICVSGGVKCLHHIYLCSHMSQIIKMVTCVFYFVESSQHISTR